MAVAEHGARPEQAALFIDVRVVPRPRELVPHLLDLSVIFREVRLDIGAVFRRELGRAAHQLFACTRRQSAG